MLVRLQPVQLKKKCTFAIGAKLIEFQNDLWNLLNHELSER